MVDKLAYRLEQGSFQTNQSQRLGQQAAAKTNNIVDQIRVLNNRKFVKLAVDRTIGVAAYATLLSTDIITILDRGFLIITFTASTVHITNIATTYFQVVVDKVVVESCYTTFMAVPAALCASIVIMVPVLKGQHNVLVQWRTDNTSARINALTIPEEHANMLVQEAA
jgi:hypothetical protein